MLVVRGRGRGRAGCARAAGGVGATVSVARLGGLQRGVCLAEWAGGRRTCVVKCSGAVPRRRRPRLSSHATGRQRGTRPLICSESGRKVETEVVEVGMKKWAGSDGQRRRCGDDAGRSLQRRLRCEGLWAELTASSALPVGYLPLPLPLTLSPPLTPADLRASLSPCRSVYPICIGQAPGRTAHNESK